MARVKLPTSTLMEAASYLVSTASERGTLPVLSMFLLIVKNDSLRVIASSTERELTYTCDVNPDDCEDGMLVVPGKKLYDVVRNAPKDSVATLRETDTNTYLLTFSGLRSKYTLRGYDSQGFPTYPLDKETMIVLAMESSALDKGLSAVINSAGEKDTRSYLNGVAFSCNKDALTLVATDGHRLSHYGITLTETPSIEEGFVRVLPRRTIRHLRDLLKGASGEVRCVFTNRHFAIRLGNRSLKTNLVDGRYPDYKNVIPATSTAPIHIDRLAWLAVANRIAILANEKFRGAQIEVKKGEDMMTLTSHNPENEEAQEQVLLSSPAQDDLFIGINIDYLRNALDHISDETVQMHFSDNASAVRLSSENDPMHLHVVMPMRI